MENIVHEIGEQLISLSAEQAEELRDYIMKEHGLVMGHIEKLTAVKCGIRDDEYWIGKYYSNEFNYWLYRNGPTA